MFKRTLEGVGYGLGPEIGDRGRRERRRRLECGVQRIMGASSRSEGEPRRPSMGLRLLAGAEVAIYAAAAVVLAALVAVVLVKGTVEFIDGISKGVPNATVRMLDSVLLMLMLVELLHTVGISLREHTLVAEPFLIVGLIAAIRRMLAITAEVGLPTPEKAEEFRLVMLELGLLTVFLLVAVLALIALHRWGRRQWSGSPEAEE